MKRFTLIPLLLVAIIVGIATSCKTTEKNYRTAYERAVTARDSDVTPFEHTIYNRYRREARDVRVISDGDTVTTRIIRVAVTADGGGVREWLKKYSVVVAGFKQLFNAKSLRDRYAGAGYPRTFLVQNAEPYYYVIVGSSDNLGEMTALADSIRATPVIPLKNDFPFILQRP